MTFLLIFYISVFINSVLGCSKIYNIDYGCPDGSPVFDRPPSSREGFNTTKWCITPVLRYNGHYDRESVCFNTNLWATSTPQNQLEMDFILKKTKELQLEKGLDLQKWTLDTDAVRKPECEQPNSCPLNETYKNEQFPVDQTYMLTHWMPGQPDYGTFNGSTRSSVAMNQDGQFISFFYDYWVSPILDADGQPEYTRNGGFCAFVATKY